MLYVLAWILWLTYRRRERDNHEPDRHVNENEIIQSEEINELNSSIPLSESAQKLLDKSLEEHLKETVSDTGQECLFDDEEHIHASLDQPNYRKKLKLVDESDIQIAGADCTFQALNFDFQNEEEKEEEQFDYSESSNLQNDDQMIHEAKLTSADELTLNSSLVGDELNISSSDDCIESDDIKQAKILSQNSFKKDRGDIKTFRRSSDSPFHEYSPRKVEKEEVSTGLHSQDEHHVSNLNFHIDTHDETHDTRHVGLIENNVKLAPLTLLVNDEVQKDSSLEDEEVHSVFKSDVVHFPPGEEPEDMNYTTKHGVRVSVKAEPTSRIHSIVVKGKQTQIRTKSPRIRAVSPKVRVTSTSSPIHIHQDVENDTHAQDEELVHLVVNLDKNAGISVDSKVNTEQQNQFSEEHIEVPMNIPVQHSAPAEIFEDIQSPVATQEVYQEPDNFSPKEFSQKENSQKISPVIINKPVHEEKLIQPISSSQVQSQPDEVFSKQQESKVRSPPPTSPKPLASPTKTPPPPSPKPKGAKTPPPTSPKPLESNQYSGPQRNTSTSSNGPLSPSGKVQKKPPRQIEQQTAAPTDFDAIMKRRKKYVDTMDDAATLLGQIANRDEKIKGSRSVNLSRHWIKVKECVRTKKYLSFKDRPMKKSAPYQAANQRL